MTAKEMALTLNNREYRSEISKDDILQAKESGLVVVFGASDDLMELRGAIDDEVGCYKGGFAYMEKDGIFPLIGTCEECKMYQRALRQCKTIEAIWCDGVPWSYRTDIPHETFEILEDGDVYCRGIVFDVAELRGGSELHNYCPNCADKMDL